MTLTQDEVDSLLRNQAKTATQAKAPKAAPATAPGANHGGKELRRILDMTVPISVTLAAREMTIKSILALTVGSIIEFDASFDADLTLNIGHHPIGAGQAVKIGENFGLRVVKLDNVKERIDAMGRPD